jgi:cell division protein FtsB
MAPAAQTLFRQTLLAPSKQDRGVSGANSRPMAAAKKKGRRPRRGVLVRRWLGVGALCLVGLLYYRPLRTYVDTRDALANRSAQVASLRGERQRLQRKLADATGDAALVREARRLGLVKSGERLFIVKGVRAWEQARRTIRRHGR